MADRQRCNSEEKKKKKKKEREKKTTEEPIVVWKQTRCTASSRIKALQRPEKKMCSEQSRKKERGGKLN